MALFKFQRLKRYPRLEFEVQIQAGPPPFLHQPDVYINVQGPRPDRMRWRSDFIV